MPSSSASAGTEECLPLVRARDRADTVKLPEPVVDAVYAHLPRPASALLSGDETWDDDERSGAVERRCESLRGPQLVGKRLAEEPCRNDDLIRAPEALHHEIPQAPTHRVADQ